MFIDGYSDFSFTQTRDETHFYARVILDTDVMLLFPYINKVVNGAKYFCTPGLDRVELIVDRIPCILYPTYFTANGFFDRSHALRFADNFIKFLNNLFENRDSITPDYRPYKAISVLEIYKLLPQSNCGDCGYRTCLAFAGAMRRRETNPDFCKGFASPVMEKIVYPVFDKNGNLASTVEIDTNISKKINNVSTRTMGNSVPKVGYYEEDGLPLLTDLTDRELEVLRFVARGATNTKISKKLSISPHTVKSHIINIFNKLGVNDRTHAAVRATRLQLL